MRTYNPGLRIRPPIRTRGILGGRGISRGAGRGDGAQGATNPGWSFSDSFNYNPTKVDYGALQRRETEIRDSYSKTELGANPDNNRRDSPSPLSSRDRARSQSRYRSRSHSRSPPGRRSRSRTPGVFRRRSRSRSPGTVRRRSRSRTPGLHRRRSRSRSPGTSRTPVPVRPRSPASGRRRSRSPPSARRRSRSPPPSRRRSRSPARRRSRTRSPTRRRSPSRSGEDVNITQAHSPKHQSRTLSSHRPKSRSHSPEEKKRVGDERRRPEETVAKKESSRRPTSSVPERGREVICSNSPQLDKNIRVTVGNYSFEDKAGASKISPLIEKQQGYKKEDFTQLSLYGDSPIVKHSDHSPSPQLPSRITSDPPVQARKAPEFDMFYDETRDIRLRSEHDTAFAHKFKQNPFAEIGAETSVASKDSRRDTSGERMANLPSHSPSPQPLDFTRKEFKPPAWTQSPTQTLRDGVSDGKHAKSILKKPNYRFADEDSSSRSGTLSGMQGYSFETAGKSFELNASTIIPGLGDLQGVEDEERFLYGDDADDEPGKPVASSIMPKATKKRDFDNDSNSGSPTRRKSSARESPYAGLFRDKWDSSETKLSRERSPYRGFRQKSPFREKSPSSRFTQEFSPSRSRQEHSPLRGREMSPFRSRKDHPQFNQEFSLCNEERKQESSQFGDIFAGLLRNREGPSLLEPNIDSAEQDSIKPPSRSLEDVLKSLGFDFDMVRKFQEKAMPPENFPNPEKDTAAEAAELYGIEADMQVSSFFGDKDCFHKKVESAPLENIRSSLSQNDAKPLDQWPGQYEHASTHQYHGPPHPMPEYPSVQFPMPPNYQSYPYGTDYYHYPSGPFHSGYEGQAPFQGPPVFQGPPPFQPPPPIGNPVTPASERPNLLVVPLQMDNSQTTVSAECARTPSALLPTPVESFRNTSAPLSKPAKPVSSTSVKLSKPVTSDKVSNSKQREMPSPSQHRRDKSEPSINRELTKSQAQVLESKQLDALAIVTRRDEKLKRLNVLQKILERLRKEQGELMRKKQKQKDGHKDPLLLENSKLQEDILNQITSLHKAIAVEGEVLGKILTPYKVNVVETKAPILQETLQIEKKVSKLDITVTPEVPKVASSNDAVECYYYDAGSHWCKQCNETFQNLKKLFQHLQSPSHLKNMDPKERPWLADPSKIPTDLNKTKKGLYTAVKGSQFVVPCNVLFCSLCKVYLGDELAAELHVKTKDHNVMYLSYALEDSDYERLWDKTKAEALISKHKERKRRMLEEQEERDRKRRKVEQEEAKDKERKKSAAMKKNQELIKAEAARNKPVDELDEAASSAASSRKEPAEVSKVKGKEIKLKLKDEKSTSAQDTSNAQTQEQPKAQDTGFGKFTWKKDNEPKTTEGPVDSKKDQVDADSKSQKPGSKIAIRLSGKTVIPPSIPWQTVSKPSQGNKPSTIAPQIPKKMPFVFPLRKGKPESSKSSVPEPRTVAADYFGLAKDSCEPPSARDAANQKGASGFAPTHSDIANAFGGVFESSLKDSNNVSPPGLQTIPLPLHDSNLSSSREVVSTAKDYKAEGDSIIVTQGMSAIVPKIPGADKVGSTGRLHESTLVVYGPTLPENYVSMPPEGNIFVDNSSDEKIKPQNMGKNETSLKASVSENSDLTVFDNKNPHQSVPKTQGIQKVAAAVVPLQSSFTTTRRTYGPFMPENYDCRPPGEDPVYLLPYKEKKMEKKHVETPSGTKCSVSQKASLSKPSSSLNISGGTKVVGASQLKRPEVKKAAPVAGPSRALPKKMPQVMGAALNKSAANKPKTQAVNKSIIVKEPTTPGNINDSSPVKKATTGTGLIGVKKFKKVMPIESLAMPKSTSNEPGGCAELIQSNVQVPETPDEKNESEVHEALTLPPSVSSSKMPECTADELKIEESKGEMSVKESDGIVSEGETQKDSNMVAADTSTLTELSFGESNTVEVRKITVAKPVLPEITINEPSMLDSEKKQIETLDLPENVCSETKTDMDEQRLVAKLSLAKNTAINVDKNTVSSKAPSTSTSLPVEEGKNLKVPNVKVDDDTSAVSDDTKVIDRVSTEKPLGVAECTLLNDNSTGILTQVSSTGEPEELPTKKDKSSVSEQKANLLRSDLVNDGETNKHAISEAACTMEELCDDKVLVSTLAKIETKPESVDSELMDSSIGAQVGASASKSDDKFESLLKPENSPAPSTGDDGKDKFPKVLAVEEERKSKYVKKNELIASKKAGEPLVDSLTNEAENLMGQSACITSSNNKTKSSGEELPVDTVVADDPCRSDNAGRADVEIDDDALELESITPSCMDPEKKKTQKRTPLKKTKGSAGFNMEKKEVPTKSVEEKCIQTKVADAPVCSEVAGPKSDNVNLEIHKKNVCGNKNASVAAVPSNPNISDRTGTTTVTVFNEPKHAANQAAKSCSSKTAQRGEKICVDCSVVLTDILQTVRPESNTSAFNDLTVSVNNNILGKGKGNIKACGQDKIVCNVENDQAKKKEMVKGQIDKDELKTKQTKSKKLEEVALNKTKLVVTAACAGRENSDESDKIKDPTKSCDGTCEAKTNVISCAAPVSESSTASLALENRNAKRVLENNDDTPEGLKLSSEDSVEQLAKKLRQEISNIEDRSVAPTLEKELTVAVDSLNNQVGDDATFAPVLEVMLSTDFVMPTVKNEADGAVCKADGKSDMTNACVSALHDAAVSVVAVLDSAVSGEVASTVAEAKSVDGQMMVDNEDDAQEDGNGAKEIVSDVERGGSGDDGSVKFGNDMVVLDETLYDTE